MTNSIAAVIFLRARLLTPAGRDLAAERLAIRMQRMRCQDAAAIFDVMVVGEYAEHGGAGTLADRPVLRKLFDDLAGLPAVRYVIATSPDRLARRADHLRTIQDRLAAAGVQLVLVDEVQPTYRCNPGQPYIGGCQTE